MLRVVTSRQARTRALGMLIAIACSLAGARETAAQPHLKLLPSVDEVRTKVRTEDPAETAAKQVVVFHYLQWMIRARAAGGEFRPEYTADEGALLQKYWQAESEANKRGLALSSKGQPASGTTSAQVRWKQLVTPLQTNPQGLLLEYLPSVARSFGLSGGIQSATPRSPEDKAKTLLGLGILIALAIYGVFAVRGTSAVFFSSVTGPAVGSTTWSETSVSSSGGSVQMVGNVAHVSPVTVSSTSTRVDEFFIAHDKGQHQITLYDGDVGVLPGHRVTAVWAHPPRGNLRYLAFVANRTTGRSYTNDAGISAARGSSLRKSFKASFVVVAVFALILAVGVGAESVASAGSERESLIWAATLAISWVASFVVGAIVIRIIHLFVDPGLASKARSEAERSAAQAETSPSAAQG